jgi:hypothetical protein
MITPGWYGNTVQTLAVWPTSGLPPEPIPFLFLSVCPLSQHLSSLSGSILFPVVYPPSQSLSSSLRSILFLKVYPLP